MVGGIEKVPPFVSDAPGFINFVFPNVPRGILLSGIGLWEKFVIAFGDRYGSVTYPNYAAISHIKLTGLNGETPETQLPRSHSSTASCTNGTTTLNAADYDDASRWAVANYRPSVIRDTLLKIAGFFAKKFPHKRMAVMLIYGGFPAVNESSLVVGGKTPDLTIEDGIIKDLGDRFPESDGKSELRCRANKMFMPCTTDGMLNDSLQRAVNIGANFVEVYGLDIERSMNVAPSLNGIVNLYAPQLPPPL